jgi:hypothetical protein
MTRWSLGQAFFLLAVFLAIATILESRVEAAELPPLKWLIAQHEIRLGGATRIHAIRSVVQHIWYKEGADTGDGLIFQMRPFYRVIGDPRVDGLKGYYEGYDGSAWEYYPDPGIVVRTIGPAAGATRHSAQIDDVLVDHELYGTALLLTGRRIVDGNDVFVVRAVLSDGFNEDVYVDTSTLMIDGIQRIVPMHAFGQRYVTHDVFKDYRPEHGVMWWHATQEVDSKTGSILSQGGIKTVQINTRLPVSMFSPPHWKKTPLQRMIELIYEERDDSGQ